MCGFARNSSLSFTAVRDELFVDLEVAFDLSDLLSDSLGNDVAADSIAVAQVLCLRTQHTNSH